MERAASQQQRARASDQWYARPTVNATPKAICSRPVWPSVAMRSRRETPPRTARAGGAAAGAIERRPVSTCVAESAQNKRR